MKVKVIRYSLIFDGKLFPVNSVLDIPEIFVSKLPNVEVLPDQAPRKRGRPRKNISDPEYNSEKEIVSQNEIQSNDL